MRRAVAAFGLLFAACGGRVVLGDLPGSGSDAGRSGDGGSDAGGGADALSGCTSVAESWPGSGEDSGSNVEPSVCKAADGAVHAFTSTADTLARLQGSWLTCSGQLLDSPAQATIGLEITGSAAWFLVVGPGSTAVRGTGSTFERTVTIQDTTATNGPGSYQVTLASKQS